MRPRLRLRPPAPKPVSFRLDVMPVFFRAGCNSGGCHGAAAGKDGFHLSLFGYDPAGDYWRLTQQIVGRRIDLAVPEQSLLLTESHRRWCPTPAAAASSQTANTTRRCCAGFRQARPTMPTTCRKSPASRWSPISSSSPARSSQAPAAGRREVFRRHHAPRQSTSRSISPTTRTTADIDDNGVVTAGKHGDTFVFARFAKYTTGAEIIVLPQDKHFKWPKIQRDQLHRPTCRRQAEVPAHPAQRASHRRRVPAPRLSRPDRPASHPRRIPAFIGDKSRDKRAELVDELLKRDEFADLWATKWAEMLKIASDNNSAFGTDRKAGLCILRVDPRADEEEHAARPVRARADRQRGQQLQDPAVNLYTMLPAGQYDPKAVAQDVAQVFTGIRIQCSQCHNHPFDRWTQDDYYGFVSFFTGVKRKMAVAKRASSTSGTIPTPRPPNTCSTTTRARRSSWAATAGRQRQRSARRAGRLAHVERQRAVPREHGESHLGAFLRPRHRRARRRRAHQQSAQQQRTDGSAGPAPGRLQLRHQEA